jgi:uncharacterized protein (DUF1501 family)
VIRRRDFLRAGAGATAASLLGGAGLAALGLAPGAARAGDYRALVVLFLTGGNDGHNSLVPTDAAYNDYQAARANLALPKASLISLSGSAAGHTFGLHPALAPLAPLYGQGRLAWIANAGPLVRPATAEQVRNSAVDVPAFLGSHSDQVAIQQGWTVQDDQSGWGGRGIERLPDSLRNPLGAVTMSNNRTLVQGRSSAPAFLDGFTIPADWGMLRLDNMASAESQAIQRFSRKQYGQTYANEYARSLQSSLDDSLLFTQAAQRAKQPTADFGSSDLGTRMRMLASLLPVLKADGYRRQVFLVEWGAFDTHANQRGSASETQDAQLVHVAQAVAGFDEAMRAAGLGDDVAMLMMSDFGRTVRPGSGGGSEHAWGNHWFALGGTVQGGTVHGTFPSYALGGPDDGDPASNGRHVPTIATDQVGATLMQWLGLPASELHAVFPDLANFGQKTIPLMRG